MRQERKVVIESPCLRVLFLLSSFFFVLTCSSVWTLMPCVFYIHLWGCGDCVTDIPLSRVLWCPFVRVRVPFSFAPYFNAPS